MSHMVRTCIDWMMSLGWIGMLLGVLLLTALMALVVMLIGRTERGSRG